MNLKFKKNIAEHTTWIIHILVLLKGNNSSVLNMSIYFAKNVMFGSEIISFIIHYNLSLFTNTIQI